MFICDIACVKVLGGVDLLSVALHDLIKVHTVC